MEMWKARAGDDDATAEMLEVLGKMAECTEIVKRIRKRMLNLN